jgi:signal transduction histidine kinase
MNKIIYRACNFIYTVRMKRYIVLGLILIILATFFIIRNDSIYLFQLFSAGLLATELAMIYYAYRKEAGEKYQKEKGDIIEKNSQKIESISQTKDEFLSFASHQLRSPLTSLKWGLNAVSDNVKNNPEASAMIQQLRTIADDMVSTVNDLLDISKIEQGGLIMENVGIDLVEMLDQVAEQFRMTAERKNLSMKFQNILPFAPVIGDRTKLRQVFSNILENAIKYTDSGSIQIELSAIESDHTFRISITDTGRGIPVEEIGNLFTKFTRGSAGKLSKGGSGLGLYLCKKIVELHKGTINIHSNGINQGSTFIITLSQDNS